MWDQSPGADMNDREMLDADAIEVSALTYPIRVLSGTFPA